MFADFFGLGPTKVRRRDGRGQQYKKSRGLHGTLGKLDPCLRAIQYRRRTTAPVRSLNTSSFVLTFTPTKMIPSRWSMTSPGL